MPRSDLSHVLLEAIRYEHWLRFYFLDEPVHLNETATHDGQSEEAVTESAVQEDLSARLSVPETCAEASRRAEPHLYPLLAQLRDHEVSLMGARDVVFRHVAEAVGLNSDDPAFGEQLLQLVSDPEFRRGLDYFHGWVQELANGDVALESEGVTGQQGGESVPSFGAWQTSFKVWADREAVRHVTTISPFEVKTTLESEGGSVPEEKNLC